MSAKRFQGRAVPKKSGGFPFDPKETATHGGAFFDYQCALDFLSPDELGWSEYELGCADRRLFMTRKGGPTGQGRFTPESKAAASGARLEAGKGVDGNREGRIPTPA